MSNVLRSNPRAIPLKLSTAIAPALLALAATFASSADAGSSGIIRGTAKGFEKLLPEVYAEGADPAKRRFNWRDLSPTVPQQFRALSANPSRDVCIAAMTSGSTTPFEPILVKVTGGRTTPSTLVVPPGTRLVFKNFDPYPHKLYQVGDAKFGPTSMSAMAQREWVAAANGKYEIRDALFPSVRTFVVVDSQTARAVYPTRNGEFAIDQLTPGEYTLKAFFGGKQVGKDLSNVRVGERNDKVDIKEAWNLGEGSK